MRPSRSEVDEAVLDHHPAATAGLETERAVRGPQRPTPIGRPRKTGVANRTATRRSRLGSPSSTGWSPRCAQTAIVHSPWRNGASKPLRRAALDAEVVLAEIAGDFGIAARHGLVDHHLVLRQRQHDRRRTNGREASDPWGPRSYRAGPSSTTARPRDHRRRHGQVAEGDRRCSPEGLALYISTKEWSRSSGRDDPVDEELVLAVDPTAGRGEDRLGYEFGDRRVLSPERLRGEQARGHHRPSRTSGLGSRVASANRRTRSGPRESSKGPTRSPARNIAMVGH